MPAESINDSSIGVFFLNSVHKAAFDTQKYTLVVSC